LIKQQITPLVQDNGFTLNTTENRWEQQLWVRVENTTLRYSLVLILKQVATLYINKLPELKLTATVDVNQCDVRNL